jgi:hypothetical protein
MVAALSAGAVRGATETVKFAITDTYKGLNLSSRTNSATVAMPLERSTSQRPGPTLTPGNKC